MVPISGLDSHRGALRLRRRAGADAPTPARTAAHQCQNLQPRILSIDVAQPNNCCSDNPWRRATAQTESPLVAISATIRTLASSHHARRRPAPVNTSSLRIGLRDSTMFSVHSKPNGQNQTADSQIRTSSERWSQDTAYDLLFYLMTQCQR
jgi:hypothetical protein